MTEKMQVSCVQSLQAVFVRCCLKEVITLFERNGYIRQADIYRDVLDKVRELPRETALDTYNEE